MYGTRRHFHFFGYHHHGGVGIGLFLAMLVFGIVLAVVIHFVFRFIRGRRNDSQQQYPMNLAAQRYIEHGETPRPPWLNSPGQSPYGQNPYPGPHGQNPIFGSNQPPPR